jgi:hypothetical protein
MGSLKFRIPDTSLYLGVDGLVSAKVDPGDEVVSVTRKNSAPFRTAYLGGAIRNIASGLTPTDSRDHETAAGIDLGDILNFVGFIGLVVDSMEYGKQLNDWITGAEEAPDPVMEALNRLHQDLSRIQEFNLAAWVTARGDNMAFLQAHSSSALHTANAFLQSKASRNDPVWAAKIAIADRDSLLAVDTFAGDIEQGFWLRPYSIAAISWAGDPTDYYQGWMPHIPDRAEVNHFNQVWDYRWALPVLCYAVVVRIAVLKAFDSGTTAERRLFCAELGKYVKIFRRIFAKIWSGIRTLEHWSDLQRNEYLLTGRIPLVAADIYGGYYLGGIYFASGLRFSRFPEGLAPPGMIEFPTRLGEIESDILAFARHWWNVIYLRIGLEDLLLLISALQGLCQGPWFPKFLSDLGQEARQIEKPGTRTHAVAGLAAHLASASGDSAPSETVALSQSLYQALHVGGKRAQAIVARCVRDLSQLAAAAGDTPPPATPPGAADRPRRKRRQ